MSALSLSKNEDKVQIVGKIKKVQLYRTNTSPPCATETKYSKLASCYK
ncbi:16217_t:CDS:2 [Dentiscutata erythropus]|uniref:16217_t:CDS:1 n=1 Tax=Dentiscutata erythropus TaxID=1348616 RepID=A0A9N9G832_9GLOM|nr:16217_t:CDS:2 [Dentiscutata erythropus]